MGKCKHGLLDKKRNKLIEVILLIDSLAGAVLPGNLDIYPTNFGKLKNGVGQEYCNNILDSGIRERIIPRSGIYV